MYDKNSQIIRKTEKNSTAKDEKDHTDKTTEYTYNALGRLTKSVVTDHKNNDEKTTTAYSYDPAGNRTKKVKGEEETSYTYNGLNQLLAARTTKGENVKNDITYDYDVNGNQIKETDTETGDSVENTYDVENRLSKAVVTKKDKGSVIQENLYNGEGQRIQKKEGASVTNYFYEDGMVSYTTGVDTGEKQIQNLSGLEDNVIYAEQKVSDTYQDFLYTKDIQGSTSSILNKDTKGELSYEYDDFGESSIHGSSALKNEICYTGGIYDESTGLYYLNARYYDPENGRFLTEDTYRGEVNDPDTLHLYAYCANDPINYVDPSGHKWKKYGDIEKDKGEKAKKAKEKYEQNCKNAKSRHRKFNTYINDQENLSYIKFKNTTIKKQGCGIIAMFNYLKLLNKTKDFLKLTCEFEYNINKLVKRVPGIAPATLKRALSSYVSITLQNDFVVFQNAMSRKKKGIMLYKHSEGAHYVTIKKNSDKGYHFYNATPRDADSIKVFLKKGRSFWTGYYKE